MTRSRATAGLRPETRRNAISLLVLLGLQSHIGAAPLAPVSDNKPGVPGFAEIARQKPRKCPADVQPAGSPAGWRENTALCAWQGRLLMRQWEATPATATRQCVSAPAAWWAWQRQRSGIASAPGAVVWRGEWRSQYLMPGLDQRDRIVAVEAVNGSWMATEWTWSPSPRKPTRDWQEQRWRLLVESVSKLGTPPPGDNPKDDVAKLRRAWEKNLRGRTGEVAADGWIWESNGMCMRLTLPQPGEPQLRLPFAREDARQEQRAAMQIQLARRYPDATWLIPFRLLELPEARGGSGAKYEAVWMDGTAVHGQLWIPTKAGGDTVRALIGTGFPNKGAAPAAQAAGAAIGRAVEAELAGLARVWVADHE